MNSSFLLLHGAMTPKEYYMCKRNKNKYWNYVKQFTFKHPNMLRAVDQMVHDEDITYWQSCATRQAMYNCGPMHHYRTGILPVYVYRHWYENRTDEARPLPDLHLIAN